MENVTYPFGYESDFHTWLLGDGFVIENGTKRGIEYNRWTKTYNRTLNSFEFEFRACGNTVKNIDAFKNKPPIVQETHKAEDIKLIPTYVRTSENSFEQKNIGIISKNLIESSHKAGIEQKLKQDYTSGKLERIAEQDACLSTNPPLNALCSNNDTVKNIEIESHGCENTVKNIDAFKSKPIIRETYEVEDIKLFPTCTHTSENLFGLSHKAWFEQRQKQDYTSRKLEKIAEQDACISTNPTLNALWSNNDPLLSETMVNQKNMAYRTGESEVEGSEYELSEEYADMLQCLEDTKDVVLPKTAKKKHKKNIDKLVKQLSSCNLEENNNQKQNFMGRKLSQKMKKNKEEKSLFSWTTKSPTNKTLMTDQLVCQHLQWLDPMLCDNGRMLCNNGRKRLIHQRFTISPDVKSIGLERCQIKEDNTEHKVDQIGNTVVDDKAKLFKKDSRWVSTPPWMTKSREKFNRRFSTIRLKTNKKFNQDISNVKAKDKCNSYPVKEVNRDFHFQKLNKIQKKKNLPNPPNHKRKIKIQKPKIEANELNSLIKNLTKFNLTEKVNTKTVKKKLIIPFLDHPTPV
ncbi:PREDICTED: uncharacterized protein LOC108771647 [Cyphomyrmex costatus]|uniref:uncharacterized protein LOC108771647 n=1 Tax=Cyphomyrmex costatus TaxID=456900 RepID=UPI000852339E|nr:PREDICTED: uncharacterized protein LOC108771647 [Cyphomyrmex costatus]